MKRLLAIAMLCFLATTAMGQATSLRVENNTPCNVYFVVYGKAAPCPFAGAIASALITVSPFSSATYSNSSMLGLPPNLFLIAADAYNQPTSCTMLPLTIWTVGDPCTGFPPLIPIYSTTSCMVCAQFYVEWVPATTFGGQARLWFHS